MPSASVLRWRNDRMLRLSEVDAQCSTTLALAPPQPNLIEENLRGYVLLLSAHFQGFCRDLYTEAAQAIVSKVRTRLQMVVQEQFSAHLKIDHGNPNLQNLKTDFERFGFTLDFARVDPSNPARLASLATLNAWRNVAAHQGRPTTAAGPLSLLLVRAWRTACDGLASSLDGIMYNELRKILRRKPW
jgi:hypothetical protein